MTLTPQDLIEQRTQYVRANLSRVDLAGDLYNLLDEVPARAGSGSWTHRAACALAAGKTRWAVRAGAIVAALAALVALTGTPDSASALVWAAGAGVVGVEVAITVIRHRGAPLELRTAQARYLVAEASLAAQVIAASSDGPDVDNAVSWYLKAVLLDCISIDRAPGAVASDVLVRRVATLMATADASENPGLDAHT